MAALGYGQPLVSSCDWGCRQPCLSVQQQFLIQFRSRLLGVIPIKLLMSVGTTSMPHRLVAVIQANVSTTRVRPDSQFFLYFFQNSAVKNRVLHHMTADFFIILSCNTLKTHLIASQSTACMHLNTLLPLQSKLQAVA